MSMMDIGHVSMFMRCAWMFVFMRVSNITLFMGVEFVMAMSVFMHNRHVDVKMSVFLIRQQ